MSIFKNKLELNQNHIQGIVACVLLGTFFIFMAGYYWGKKSAVEQLAGQFEHDSFADKIYSSMCSLYETPEVEPEVELESESDKETPEETTQKSSEPLYYAQLIGFGSEKPAYDYVQKLRKYDIIATVVERVSTSPRGKLSTWYQVITEPMDKNSLTALTERLVLQDRLTGIKIVELTPQRKASS